MRLSKVAALAAGAIVAFGISAPAFANGLLYDTNGNVRLGANDDGSIDASTEDGFIGIGYNFTGQGGRVGFNDALTPGCPCEAWGVSANGITGHVGQATGNTNIGVALSSSGTNDNSSAGATATFTSNTFLASLPGLTVTQEFSLAAMTATGALFMDKVTITNSTGALATDVRFARAMDWDVPPTEFSEWVRIQGTASTASLLHSTDNGFAEADPIGDMSDGGICGPVDSDGTTGPCDHGALFIFGFGDLADGASQTLNIFYGAGLDEVDTTALLALIGPELYSLGESNSGGFRRSDFPTFIFAFNGVGGVVQPGPTDTPEPMTLALFGAGLAGLGALRRRRK